MRYRWAPMVLVSLAGARAQVPQNESLLYSAEWRLIRAGNATLTWSPAAGTAGWETRLKLESVGLVSMLHKVNNEYTSALDESLCAASSLLKTNEGRKQRETAVTFNQEQKKASYLERDTVKNTVVDSHEIDIPGCVHDVIAALYRLRTMKVEMGAAVQIPISDGKKSVQARVEAQERETVRIGGVTYRTVRYEAFLFNNVLYRRRGRLFVWLSDDERRLPVQLRVRLPFYIGTVTLQLSPEKKKT
ncbi:MAG: DUF3108 domain-containing protein [Acidobacteriota bacterium]